MSLLERIYMNIPNVPKGFEKFFEHGNKQFGKIKEAAANAGKKAEGKSAGNGKSSGSGSTKSAKGGNKEGTGNTGKAKEGAENTGNDAKFNAKQTKDPDKKLPQKPRFGAEELLTAALGIFLWTNYMSSDNSNGREINWQEFKTMLLATGAVERLVIVNKQYCKVYLNRKMMQNSSASASSQNQIQASNLEIEEELPATFATADDKYASTSIDKYDENNAGQEIQDTREGSYGKIIGPQQTQPSYYFTIGSVDSFEHKLEQAQRELGISSRHFIPVQYVNQTNWMSELGKLAPTLLLIGAWVLMMRNMSGGAGGGGMSNIFKIGKSNAKMIGKDSKVGITFKDVAGCDEAKAEIMEFVEFLKNPKRFTVLGAKIPKGALLCGPPGTGKTLLAKATAGEASVPFFSISGSDFIEMFVGVGPSRVRDLFSQARQNAPCIVFIDEIDAVARARGKGGFSGGNDERENTLNQLLVEMDGFSTKEGVVVLAGTNRIDILDQAILRPGRFDRQIKVDLPDIKGRKEIFMVHLRDIEVEGDKEHIAQRMAALTPGFAGAQIANICNEAAIQGARRGLDKVDMDCFEKATDRVIGGLEKKNSIMSEDERKTVAYHEAGHAVVGWFLEHADPLLKVTIVPRMSGALGFAQYLPKELALHSKEQLIDRMCMALGGRAAEEITFGRITTGAADDLDKVTKMAYSMVTVFGMNEKIGNLSFPKNENQLVESKMYSEKTAEIIDQEVFSLVNDAYARAKQLLMDQNLAVKAIAEKLLAEETITQHDIAAMIGPRPFAMSQSYDEFLSASGHLRHEATDKSADDDDDSETTHIDTSESAKQNSDEKEH
eukprot:CAMPEP_0204861742 /NCGR_PEP_ID=MMETSP1348-20121228/1866_1 /ASSEMBLY_ACC=CAM_ASM_000700 /TAXON_ID=215587 /ORGANISM="Aplanochytrium stocchinoi, Strain GSBS06" /LENGTH=833 /DNA_ID=CAMNT_0052011305 /DNA_START=557 /DNA_END=3058 /DNA_ORIENTATION=+